MLVTVCLSPETHCGELDFAPPEARSALYRTDDLGRSWIPVATLDGAYYVRGWSGDGGRALLMDTSRRDRYVVWPEMTELDAPADARDPSQSFSRMVGSLGGCQEAPRRARGPNWSRRAVRSSCPRVAQEQRRAG